jgi:CheY-like chemotaxis protein
MKVLIVDDVPANLYSLRDILNGMSNETSDEYTLEVLQATSGDEALKILLQCNEVPVLAILDVQMPIMDGYQLADIMRTHPRMRYIRLFFCRLFTVRRSILFEVMKVGGSIF